MKIKAFFLSLFRGSLIINALEAFCDYVYKCLAGGIFGRIFRGYTGENELFLNSFVGSTVRDNLLRRKIFRPIRRLIASGVEQSIILRIVSKVFRHLLRCRLRVYGIFLASFGMYVSILNAAGLVIKSIGFTETDMIFGVGMILGSVPLLLSKKSLSSTILEGKIASFLAMDVLGFRRSQIDVAEHSGASSKKKSRKGSSGGYSNIAFILGMICGFSTYLVDVKWILLGIVGAAALLMIFSLPEIGVMLMIAILPFAPTKIMIAAVMYVFVAYAVKLVLGRRTFRLTLLDFSVILFMGMMFMGGVVSLSRSSLKPALLYVCFMMSYFLVVNLIRTKDWLFRCVGAVIFASFGESAIGVMEYVTGAVSNSKKSWLDSDMFDSISGRVISTLENPNMLAEYLILTIPFAIAALLAVKNGKLRFLMLGVTGVIGACILLTWSRGAWLGMIFSALVFLMIWTKRSIYIMVAGAASIPFLPFILPESIISRFTSIGNLGDSSTSYRVYIWKAAVRMIEDHPLGGIGVSEGAFRSIYPMYSISGIEAAPHSHNLYLQIWLEIGIFGLLAFLLFLFFLMQSHFSFYGSSKCQDTRYRLMTGAGLCGIAAVLVQSLTDYTWYNYRVYLMFWLVAGLSAAFIRCAEDVAQVTKLPDATQASADIRL